MKRIFTLCIAVFAVISAFAQPQKVVADKIVSIVGDRIILNSDLRNAIADLSRQNEGQLPADILCRIMEQALVSKVMMLQAEKDSLVVTEEEIEAELDQRVRYFINLYGSTQVLEEIAGKTVYQIKDEARESVQERKLAEAMQRKIVSNVRITPTEAKAFFEKIPVDSLPFFETELEVGQIVLYPKASRELEEYVINELNNYKRQIEMKLTTFEQLARNNSEDPAVKQNGGRYELNRNEKNTWDPVFLAAAFRLKDGEISAPVKTQFGYHIIQMEKRSGDDAIVRHILRIPPVTEDEVRLALSKLDTIRSKIIAGTLDFGAAGTRYSESPEAKYVGPWIISRDGDPYNTIDELDKDLVTMLDKLKVGEYSQAVAFDDPSGKKAVRFVYLKSKSEPHRMNLKDDYNKISEMALEEKKMTVLDKWLQEKMTSYYIMIDEDITQNCDQLKKWTSDKKAF